MKNIAFLKSPLIAHRGVHYKYKENSLKAFKMAIIEGYTIEFDVHLTKDDKIVVYHDNNLKRLTGVDKEIWKCTYDEIISIINVPTIDEVLDLVNGEVALIIELKFSMKFGKLEKLLVDVLDNYVGEFAVQSFNPYSIMWFRKHRKNYVRGYLINNSVFIKFIMYLLLKPDFVAVNIRTIKKTGIQNLRRKCIIIGYTIKDNRDYNMYYSYADNFICDIGKEPYKRLLDR